MSKVWTLGKQLIRIYLTAVDLLALLAIFPLVISSFFTQNKGCGGGGGGGSATDKKRHDKIMTTMEYAAEDENFIGFEGTE